MASKKINRKSKITDKKPRQVNKERVITGLVVTIRILLLLICVTPLVIHSSVIYPFIVGKAIYARVLIEIALALWLFLVAVAPENRPRRSWVLLALCVWLFISLTAAVFGENIARSLWSSYNRMDGVIDFAHWAAFALMVASMIRTRDHWRHVLMVNAAVAGIIAVVGLVSQFVPAPELASSRYFTRLYSTMGSSFFLGIYMCLSIGLMAVLITLSRNKKIVWVILPMILCLITLWLSASRGGLLALIFMAVVFSFGCLMINKHKLIRITAIATIVTVLSVITAMTLIAIFEWGIVTDSDLITTRFSHALKGSDSSINQRVHAALVAIHVYRDHPVLGIGPENFILAWGHYSHAEWLDIEIFDDAHNIFLEVLSTTGTFGIISYGVLCLLTSWVAFRSIRNSQGNDRLFPLAIGTVLSGYFILCLVAVNSSAFSMIFALLLGYAIGEEFRRHPEQRGRPIFAVKSLKAVAVGAMLSSVLLFSLIQYNLNVFLSAGIVLPDANPHRFIAAERSTQEYFPAMTNERRQILFTEMIGILGRIQHDDAVNWYVAALSDEIDLAMESEPDNWIWPYLGSALYYDISTYDLSYIDRSEYYTSRLEQLSPTSRYSVKARERQGRLEFALGD